jgi:parvulin-like peptidyl-prolyl isomerase
MFVLFMGGLMAYLAGCTAKPKTPESEVVARINQYRMTIEDFKSDALPMLNNVDYTKNAQAAKQEILAELITRELLLQEAQRFNLDKEKPFIKEIENYWKQSLLKVLIWRKNTEFIGNIQISENEIRSEYERMKRKLFAQIIVLSDERAARELSQAKDFEAVKLNVKDKIIAENTPEWWQRGDLSANIEAKVFALKTGEVTAPIKNGPNWLLIRVIKEEPLPVESYAKMAPQIKNTIINRMVKDSIDKWIADLIKQSRIKVNQGVLEKIKITNEVRDEE